MLVGCRYEREDCWSIFSRNTITIIHAAVMPPGRAHCPVRLNDSNVEEVPRMAFRRGVRRLRKGFHKEDDIVDDGALTWIILQHDDFLALKTEETRRALEIYNLARCVLFAATMMRCVADAKRKCLVDHDYNLLVPSAASNEGGA